MKDLTLLIKFKGIIQEDLSNYRKSETEKKMVTSEYF